MNATQGFREFEAARRTIQGYEAMHMIRKGQGEVGERFGRSATDSVHQLFEVADPTRHQEHLRQVWAFAWPD